MPDHPATSSCTPRWASTSLLGVVCALSACALSPPRAWEKDLLARPAMAMQDDPLGQRARSHIYSSKENSSGGDGVGGGDCGCN